MATSLERRPRQTASMVGTLGTQRVHGVLLVVGVLAAAVLASCTASSTSGGVAGASPALGQSVSPSAMASTLESARPSTPDASPSAVASGSVMRVTLPLGGPHSVIVTIEDRSGELVSARAMTLQPDEQVPPSYGDRNIAAWNPGGKPSPELRVYWGGVICDTTTDMIVGSGPTAITVTEGAVPTCDASNDGRGVVLTFASAVDAGRIVATFIPAQPTQ